MDGGLRRQRNVRRPSVPDDRSLGESLGAGRLGLSCQQAIIVLLQYVSRTQESVECSLVQKRLALRVARLVRHLASNLEPVMEPERHTL